MAKCVRCGKKGLFLKVNQRGMCPDCAEQRLKDLYALANQASPALHIAPKLSEQMVMGFVKTTIENSNRIILDSAAIIETTNNPDTFYSRLDLLRKHMRYLVSFDAMEPSLFAGERPAAIAAQMDEVVKKSESDMWKRCFEATMEKVDKLKTEKGKKNAINKFFELASQYDSITSATTKETISNLKKRFDITL